MKPTNKILRPAHIACTLLITLFCLATFQTARAQNIGDVQVLATFPTPPGFPEGVAVNGSRVYVSGPARFGNAGEPPSKVIAYDIATGATVREYAMQGENTALDHANSCIAFDGAGRLYVVNTQLGIVRIDIGTGAQEPYAATLPNLPPCNSAPAPCSPTFIDLPPLPNDIAFDEDGNLYLTDSFQATIWRIAPGGGQPQIWFQSAQLDRPFGANGLRISPDRTKVYFAVTAEGVDPMTGAFLGGKIYTLPLVNAPAQSDLQVFHQYNGEAPDGIAFGRSGKLYVVEAAPFNSGISILRADGTEEARLTNTVNPIDPYDSPANAAFDKHGSLLVTNHAFLTGIPTHFTILKVFVDDKGLPLIRPDLP